MHETKSFNTDRYIKQIFFKHLILFDFDTEVEAIRSDFRRMRLILFDFDSELQAARFDLQCLTHSTLFEFDSEIHGTPNGNLL